MNARAGDDRDKIGLDEAQEILPWYVTGRTSRAETRAIEDLLKESADLRTQLEEARAQRQAILDGNATIGEPSATTLTRLLQQIETTKQRRFIPEAQPGILARLIGPHPVLKLALAFACLLVVAQAGLIYRSGNFPFGSGQPGGSEQVAAAQDGDSATTPETGYAAASAEVPAVAETLGAELVVAFRPDVTAAQINQILTELDARIVDGPKPGLSFVLRLAVGADAEAAIARLQSRPDLIATAQRR